MGNPLFFPLGTPKVCPALRINTQNKSTKEKQKTKKKLDACWTKKRKRKTKLKINQRPQPTLSRRPSDSSLTRRLYRAHISTVYTRHNRFNPSAREDKNKPARTLLRTCNVNTRRRKKQTKTKAAQAKYVPRIYAGKLGVLAASYSKQVRSFFLVLLVLVISRTRNI